MIDGARLVVHGTDDGIEWETLLQVMKVSLVIDGAPTQVFPNRNCNRYTKLLCYLYRLNSNIISAFVS